MRSGEPTDAATAVRPSEAALSPAARAVRGKTGLVPEAGLLLGSGLEAIAAAVEDPWSADYADLPGWAPTTVAGHPGRLVLGRLEGRNVLVLAGRVHTYEGRDPRAVTAGVRLLHELGGRALLLTNAAGSLRRRFPPGTLLLLSDHLNLLRQSPLVGRAPDEIHDMFPDMSEPYDLELRGRLREAALAAGVPLEEGVYAAVQGPSYETPAEVELLRRAGADAVGMSTVPEVLAARERGLRVVAISCLTNLASGLSPAPLSHAEVVETAARAAARLATLVRAFLRALPA
jgi:purine-nucleoside phosphorylase